MVFPVVKACILVFAIATASSFAADSLGMSEAEIREIITKSGMPNVVAPKNMPDARDLFLTKSYLEFSELDPSPYELIEWDADSAKFLVAPNGEAPYVIFRGKLKEGHELSLNDNWVPMRPDGTFEVKVPIPHAPTLFSWRIFRPDRSFVSYRLIQFWLKMPPTIRMTVRGANGEKALGYSENSGKAGQAQLYSEAIPVSVVDLDSQKHSSLTFRLYTPPDSDITYDSWTFTIKNSKNQTIGQINRLGTPPPYIDWRDVAGQVIEKDTYTYQLNLIHASSTYEGAKNSFETIEGLSLLNHNYLPFLSFEPTYQIGYFSFANLRGVDFSNLYIGADLPIVLGNRFIIRGTANTSLHSIDPRNNFTYTRVGLGTRFFGQGENDVLGHPHIYRFDVLINDSAYTIYPGANITRIAEVSLLLEPQFVLWAYNFIVPTIEYGTRSALDAQSIALGLDYYFYVRPWSVRIGFGVKYEHLFDYHPMGVGYADSLRFNVLRTQASVSLFL